VTLHDILAIAFLTLVLVAFVVLLWSDYRRCHFTPLQYVFWWVARSFGRLLWRATIPEFPLPPGRGAVVVCNHRSSVDPIFVQSVVRRPVHWMVAKEYHASKAFGWFLTMCETIPVSRGGIDTAATKLSIRLAEQGGLVGMFPEGRINATENFMLACRPGAILVAIRSQVPLLPCYIEGAPFDETPLSPLSMPANVTVRFGEPIDVTAYAGVARHDDAVGQLMKTCMRAIAELAGQSDFEPQLAGRRWKPSAEEVAADMEAQRARRAQQRRGG